MGEELVSILYTYLREEVLEVAHVLSTLGIGFDLGQVKLITDLFSHVSLGLASGLGFGWGSFLFALGRAAGAGTAAAGAAGGALNINLGEVALKFFVIEGGDIGENLGKGGGIVVFLRIDLCVVLEDFDHVVEVFILFLFVGLRRAHLLMLFLFFGALLLFVIGMLWIARTNIIVCAS